MKVNVMGSVSVFIITVTENSFFAFNNIDDIYDFVLIQIKEC